MKQLLLAQKMYKSTRILVVYIPKIDNDMEIIFVDSINAALALARENKNAIVVKTQKCKYYESTEELGDYYE